MSRADTWMPLYVADYLRDTTHLSAEEHGGYLLLLMGCWTRGGSLPGEDAKLAAIARMTPAAWKRSRATIMEFFTRDDGGWTHRRVAAELSRAADLSEKRRQAGAKGGDAKAQNAGKPLANAKQEGEQKATPARVALPSPSPSPEGECRDADASPVGSAEPMPTEVEQSKPKPDKPWKRDRLFAEAWLACTDPMRARSAAREKTWPAWARASIAAGGPDRLLAALKAYVAADKDVERTGGPGFHRWLQDGKWQHWLEVGEAAGPAPVWTGPPELRASAVALKSEAWCVSYLDRCGWRDLPERALTPPGQFVAKVIRSEIGELLARCNVSIQEQAA